MIKRLEKYPIWAIVIASGLMLLFHLDVLNLTIMEARNFITAREMIDDGNWLLTTMNGEPRYQKPPLPTWLTAISGLIFGMESLYGLRLPAALFVMLTGIMMFLLSKQLLKDTVHALVNALIVITSFYVIGIMNEAPWDIFTHGFMLTGIYFLFRFFEEEGPQLKWAALAGLMLGCSFMSKGPVSLYALFLPFIIAYAFTFKFKSFKRKWFALATFILLFVVVGLWWFLYVRMADPATFEAITSKETGNWSSYNVRPFYYYWSFFTQSGIWTIPAFVGLLYPYLKNRVQNKTAYRFSFYWTIFSVILLSIIPEKKARYLMPVLIPLALNTGFYLQYLFREFSALKDKRETWPVYFNFGLVALICLAFPVAGYFLFKEQMSDIWGAYILTSGALSIIGVWMVLRLRQKQIKAVFYLTITFLVCLMLFGLPLAKTFNTNNEYTPIAKYDKSDSKVYSYDGIAPEFVWLHEKPITRIKTDDILRYPVETTFVVLVNKNQEDEFKRIFESDFEVRLDKVLDLNKTAKPDERGHKNRLVAKQYQVKKKQP